MTAAGENEVRPHQRQPSKAPKDSLRHGEAEYGRHFSGGAQITSVYVNSTLDGQWFFGAEIVLTEPVTLLLKDLRDDGGEVNLYFKEIWEEKITGKTFEFTSGDYTEQILSLKIQNANYFIYENQKDKIKIDEFLIENFGEQEISPQFSLAELSEIQSNGRSGFDNTGSNRLQLLHPIPNLVIQLGNQLAPMSIMNSDHRKLQLSHMNSDYHKPQFSEPITATSPPLKSLLPIRIGSNDYSILKSVGENIGDTLMSDSLSRLDARYSPEIEFIVYNGKNNAVLIGNVANNMLIGGIGNDTLTGAGGNDQLIGGAGNDVFVFDSNDGHDQVVDFSSGDKLQFRGIISSDQLALTSTEFGQKIQFGQSTVDIIGFSELMISSDWLILNR